MIIEKIDETRLIISLADEDMKVFEINFDGFLWENKHSRNIIKKLLKFAKDQTGFSSHNKRLMVEVAPKKDGCVILFTLLSDYCKRTSKLYQIKRKCKCFIFEFETSEDLICALERIYNLNDKVPDSKIILYNKCYYIILYCKDKIKFPLYSILSEYGYHILQKELYSWDMFKYGNVISKENAIYEIGSYFK